MKKSIAIIGAGSSAGAHWPGQEKAPQYLRKHGLIEQLKSVGQEVLDLGDIPISRFKPDIHNRSQQNLFEVIKVCHQVSNKVDNALNNEIVPIIIGGDCTISLGVISSLVNHYEDLGILYFDGHVDLNTPVTSQSGIFDSMGLAHIIGLSGASDELSHIGNRFPLIPKEKVILFGYNPNEINKVEHDLLTRNKFIKYPLPDIRGQEKQSALEAINYLENKSERFLVHFDVDVIDFTDLPIADVPQFSQGMMFEQVLECLSVFTLSKKFCGLVITELNPDHTDPEGKVIKRFINGLTKVLSDHR